MTSVGQRLAQADALWVAFAFLLFAAVIVFAAGRWWIMLRALSAPLPFAQVMRFTFVGLFFNQVLPSNVGGDAFRVYYTWRAGVAPQLAFNTVLLDRVLGLIVLVFIASVTFPLLAGILDNSLALGGLLALLLAVWVAAALLFVFDNAFTRRFERFRIMAFAIRLSRNARQLARQPGAMFAIVATSLVLHGMTFAIVWTLDRALGGDAPYLLYLLAMAPTQLLASIPVSIAGWGVREQALVILLGAYGLSAVHALSVSVLFGLVLLVGGLPGGLAWLVTRRTPMKV